MPTAPESGNLILHLMADAGVSTDTGGSTPATASGDAVARWADQSGSGNHVTQSTSAQQPTYRLSVVNGLPVVRFQNGFGITTRLTTGGSVAHGIGTGDFWLAAVFAARVPVPGWNTIFSIGSFAPGFYCPISGDNTGSGMLLGSLYSFAAPITSATFYLIEIARVNGTLKAWMSSRGAAPAADANSFTPSPSQTIAPGVFHVGDDNLNDYMNGDIAELLFYNAALSSSAQATTEGYLRAKYWTPRLMLHQPMTGLGSGGPFFADRLVGI